MVSLPSGSIKSWCLSLLENLSILSSIEGQYLGPVPLILPENIGESSKPSFSIAWTSGDVYVIKQECCFPMGFLLIKEKLTGFSSPNCSSVLE